MSKFIGVQRDIFSIFASVGWNALGIKTVPREFTNIELENEGNRVIRVSILPNQKGVNKLSISGMMLVEIMTLLTDGPTPIVETADALSDFFDNKSIETYTGVCTQFFSGTLGVSQKDSLNPRIGNTLYSINFQYNTVE